MKVQNDVKVTIKVDKNLEEKAEALFDSLGLNMSMVFNMFLRKAVNESAIPFAVSEKTDGFARRYSSDEISDAFSAAVQKDITENKNDSLTPDIT